MDCDLLVIGGGINGVGIALDAAGRGLNVILCEKDDLASATSSNSSKLIHGGLRYLEQGNLRLVQESLAERRLLLQNAPHLVHPQRFILPHSKHSKNSRPYWIVRTGLFLYDLLGKRKNILPKSHGLSVSDFPELESQLQSEYHRALSYYDCTVDDARLVVTLALFAKQKQAKIFTRTKFIKLIPKENYFECELQSAESADFSNSSSTSNSSNSVLIRAKAVINAAGPWSVELLQNNSLLTTDHNTNQITNHTIHWVQGSHIVIPSTLNQNNQNGQNDHNNAFLLQNEDGRVVFVIPYLKHFILIGTTDLELQTLPVKPTILNNEIDYLCNVYNRYFKKSIDSADICWHFSGIRSLVSKKMDHSSSNPSQLSRDYVVDFQLHPENKLPIISILSGKITTYRSLAEKVIDSLKSYFPHMKGAWTKSAVLPGGDLPNGNLEAFEILLINRYPNLPKELLSRFARNYGTRSMTILGDAKTIQDLGNHYGGTLYEIEIDYLKNEEWAKTMDDILWRRTKVGLFLKSE